MKSKIMLYQMNNIFQTKIHCIIRDTQNFKSDSNKNKTMK